MDRIELQIDFWSAAKSALPRICKYESLGARISRYSEKGMNVANLSNSAAYGFYAHVWRNAKEKEPHLYLTLGIPVHDTRMALEFHYYHAENKWPLITFGTKEFPDIQTDYFHQTYSALYSVAAMMQYVHRDIAKGIDFGDSMYRALTGLGLEQHAFQFLSNKWINLKETRNNAGGTFKFECLTTYFEELKEFPDRLAAYNYYHDYLRKQILDPDSQFGMNIPVMPNKIHHEHKYRMSQDSYADMFAHYEFAQHCYFQCLIPAPCYRYQYPIAEDFFHNTRGWEVFNGAGAATVIE